MKRNLASPIVLICIGCAFLAHNMLPGFDIGRWWPVILIAVGLSWLADRGMRRNHPAEPPARLQ